MKKWGSTGRRDQVGQVSRRQVNRFCLPFSFFSFFLFLFLSLLLLEIQRERREKEVMRDERWNMSSGIIFLSSLSDFFINLQLSSCHFSLRLFLYELQSLSLSLSLELSFLSLAQFLPSYFSSRKDSVWEKWNGMKKRGKKNWVSSFTLFHLLPPFYFIFFFIVSFLSLSILLFLVSFRQFSPKWWRMRRRNSQGKRSRRKTEGRRWKKGKRRREEVEENEKLKFTSFKRFGEVERKREIFFLRRRKRTKSMEEEKEYVIWMFENETGTKRREKEKRERMERKDLHTKCLPFFSLSFFFSIFFPSRNHSIWKCKTNNTERNEMKCRQNHALVNFAKHSSYG